MATEISTDITKIKDLLEIVSNDLTNSISLLGITKADSLGLILAITALIGVVGYSIIKSFMEFWIVSSIILIFIFFVKYLKPHYPTKNSLNKYQSLLEFLGKNDSQQYKIIVDGILLFKNSKPLCKAISLIFFTNIIIILIAYAQMIQIPQISPWLVLFIILTFLVFIVLSTFAEWVGLILMFGVLILSHIHTMKKNPSVIKSISITQKGEFFLIIVVMVVLALLLVGQLNNLLPLFDNLQNLSKIAITLVVQIIFIAIFSEYFSKSLATQVLMNKISNLSCLKDQMVSELFSETQKRSYMDYLHDYKFFILYSFHRKNTFLFFDKNEITLNSCLDPQEDLIIFQSYLKQFFSFQPNHQV